MKKTRESHTLEFTVGTSVQLDLHRGRLGLTAVVSAHVGNPFNHGTEIEENRSEIAKNALQRLGVKPHELLYVEQAGQHYQDVPLIEDGRGEVVKDPGKRISLVTRAQLSARLDADSPDCGPLKMPPRR